MHSNASFKLTPCALSALKPSATDQRLTASNILLTAFTANPEPDSPTCLINLPTACRAGNARSKAATSPPTITVKVAFSAPTV
ncbi:hypothetical protein D3C81_345480 [compost metagenome]